MDLAISHYTDVRLRSWISPEKTSFIGTLAVKQYRPTSNQWTLGTGVLGLGEGVADLDAKDRALEASS